MGGKGCSDSQFTTGGPRLVLAVSHTPASWAAATILHLARPVCEPRTSPRASEDKSSGGGTI